MQRIGVKLGAAVSSYNYMMMPFLQPGHTADF